MKTFTPRKKKNHVAPKMKNMKSVRIDDHTMICVSKDISDEEARERFRRRYNANPYAPEYYIPPKIHNEVAKIKGVGSLEEMAAIIDDALLPDLE
jgi:hypothetical protein